MLYEIYQEIISFFATALAFCVSVPAIKEISLRKDISFTLSLFLRDLADAPYNEFSLASSGNRLEFW